MDNESRAIQHAGGAMAQQIQRPNNGDAMIKWSKEEMQVLTDLIAKDCTPVELKLFSNVCHKTGLDPFSRQIYAIKRNSRDGKKMTIQTSIDGFRAIAEDTGQYAGNDDAVFDGGLTLAEHIAKTGNPKTPPITATVTVYKMVDGQRCPYSASAAFAQYAQKSPVWENIPHTMIAKCAEALALRKAFPRKLSGLYTGDEMEQADNTPNTPIAEHQTNGNTPKTANRAEVNPKPTQTPTPAQMSTISRLIKSHVFDEERPKIEARIQRGLSFAEASTCIDWLTTELPKRKQAEQAADEEPPEIEAEEMTPEQMAELDETLNAIDPDGQLVGAGQ